MKSLLEGRGSGVPDPPNPYSPGRCWPKRETRPSRNNNTTTWTVHVSRLCRIFVYEGRLPADKGGPRGLIEKVAKR